MGKVVYSVDLCRELVARIEAAGLEVAYRPRRYEAGGVLDLRFTSVWPEAEGHGRFRVEKFVGGGFAGQVYRCTVEALEIAGMPPSAGWRIGDTCAVKIMLPPSVFSRRFRDLVYWLGFQGPFSAQVNMAACRAGLLWQKLVRRAAAVEFGREDAVADVFASFYDPALRACGEIREWVEGRTWRLEPDLELRRRRAWRDADPRTTGSPEYVEKRQFMSRFVALLHEMGAVELARQYEWWTMKSQPNVLKRTDGGTGGLCAVDFRAGLALLPFLPMSPKDVGLIFSGLRRGSLTQFDRCDFRSLRRFFARHAERFGGHMPMVEALERYDRSYRRSLPDVLHHGWRLVVDGALRRDVRRGMATAYGSTVGLDPLFADRLSTNPWRFAGFYVLGAIPLAGRWLRRVWGSAASRRHLGRLLASWDYFSRARAVAVWSRLVDWLRAGRCGEGRGRYLSSHLAPFWLQQLTLGWLPATLHRALAEPRFVAERIREGFRFALAFYRDAGFRERWLRDLVHQGCEEGVLDADERDRILSQVADPFIAKYLKCLAVHFATLPVSEITWMIVGVAMASWEVIRGATWGQAFLDFGTIGAVALLAIPVSPGSLVRGVYVLYLMIKERNLKDYIVAAPISLLKIVGYLAFPIQMVTAYPALSRFMAGRWATDAVRIVPVFGEKGALLEHLAFDLCFNLPRIAGRWISRRVKGFLNAWALFGLGCLVLAFGACGVRWSSHDGFNLFLAVSVFCFMPRFVFYPLLIGKKRSQPDG